MDNNNRIQSFERFFGEWLIRQEQYLEELENEIESSSSSSTSNDIAEERRKELITRILEHYHEYYAAKARFAREDVFLLFCPPWLTSLERCYLWLAGFRPRLAFQMVFNFVFDLTEDQSRRINSLMDEIIRDAQQLTEILTAIQRGMVEMVAHEHLGQVQNGEQLHLHYSNADSFRVSMEPLVESADYLRGKTLMKILEILTSSQTLRFLAAGAQFHLNLRRYGGQP